MTKNDNGRRISLFSQPSDIMIEPMNVNSPTQTNKDNPLRSRPASGWTDTKSPGSCYAAAFLARW